MKILNIDSLVTPKRSLKLKGVAHVVKETSVQAFIDALGALEAIEKADGTVSPETLKKTVIQSVDTILESVPSVPRADLMELPLEALGVILQFIRGELDSAAEASADAPAVAAVEEEGADAKKPT